MERVYLGLGGNIGDRRAALAAAARMLNEAEGLSVIAKSSLYASTPWGKTDQPEFYNAVLACDCQLSPHQLLTVCHSIEQKMGRKRKEHWGPRLIDIDILLFGSRQINEPDLQIPHSYLELRAFVVIPLIELNPKLTLPDGRFLADLLSAQPTPEITRLHKNY